MVETMIDTSNTLRFYEEKMYPSSLAADWAESLPWHAFLVPSVPKLALILYGAYFFAFSLLVGPRVFRQRLIASGAMSSSPTAKSDVINYISFGKNYFPWCSA